MKKRKQTNEENAALLLTIKYPNFEEVKKAYFVFSECVFASTKL